MRWACRVRTAVLQLLTAVQQFSHACVASEDLCVYFKGIYSEEIRAVDGVSLVMRDAQMLDSAGSASAAGTADLESKRASGELLVCLFAQRFLGEIFALLGHNGAGTCRDNQAGVAPPLTL